ncbi:MAG: FAD-binding and (Fe-S)-binding domain-containing protein [Candidatus Binataceae bacterium]
MASLDSFKDQLKHSIEGEVRFDAGSRALYAIDASNYRRVPVGVIIPRHEEDVVRAVALARENAIPVLARGGGTALAGQTTNTALVIDFSKYMNAVAGIDTERRLARVQPGLVQAHLNQALAQYNLFFPPDPATKDRCTLGGMIGNNSCGAHSAAYGKTVDNLEKLEILLYDGTRLALGGEANSGVEGSREARIYAQTRDLITRYGDLVRERYPKIPRRVSGYNLDELLPERGFNLARAMVGSEGTLGIVLEGTVKLVSRPKRLALVVAGFEDVFAAADQMPWMLRHHPQALEGFDARLADFGRAKGLDAVRLLPNGRAFLLIELAGESDDAVRNAAEVFRAEAKNIKQCAGVNVLLDAADQGAVWRLRESGLGAGALMPGQARTWPGAEDCAVPPARLGEYLRRFVKLLERHRLEAAIYYGHFGEGCIHCRINFDLVSAAGIANFRATMLEIADLVSEFGGSLSGEHGDGLARSELLDRMFGPRMLDAFREFKDIFDPDHKMNPGVIVAAEPLDSNLRLGPYYSPRQVRTHFDFSADEGLAGAALRCVGIGKCRKTDAGTMCPSYMATHEEKHSTRGRAHLLHEALAGDLLGDGFAQREVYEALELCLSCKGCKTECPASVDMAAYKAEFMASFYREHRRAADAHFFGRIHEFAWAASMLPRVVNRIAASAAGEMAKRWLRIHPARALPSFAPETFRSWFKHHPVGESTNEVMLFPDTFNNFFEPAVAIAAVEVLERAGFRVMIPPRDLCCGRPLYDQGMLEAARRRLAGLLKTLSPHVARGIPVIGLEPSCILTFRDELPMMFPRASDARALAARTFMLDEFLAKEAPTFTPPSLRGDAIVHGHCHQKALASLTGELSILRKASELTVVSPDAGCCGMAGAFGYGMERYEISRTIGERVLLPAVRNSPADTLIIADGFACRSQIRHFCPDRRPMHFAEVLNLTT